MVYRKQNKFQHTTPGGPAEETDGKPGATGGAEAANAAPGEGAGAAAQAGAKDGKTPYTAQPAPDEQGYEPMPELKPKRKKRVGRIVFISIAGLVAALILFNVVSNALRGPTPTYVEVQPATVGNIEQSISTTGILATGEKVTVFSPVTAPLSAVNGELGGLVRAGQPLFSFDVTDLERSHRQAAAAASLAGLQAQAANTASAESQQTAADYQAGVDNIKDQLRIAQERLTAAQAAYNEKAAALLPLMQPIQERIAALEAQLAQTTDPAAYTQLSMDLDAERRALKGYEDELAPLSAAVSAAQADVDYHKTLLGQLQTAQDTAENGVLDANGRAQQQAQGVSSQVALEQATAALAAGQAGVLAPISGVITSLSAQEGALGSQYSPLCTIESLDKVDAVISLTRYDLERVSVGQRAVVKSLGREYAATVTKIDGMATTSASSTGTSTFVSATVSLTNPDANLKLGLEAEVRIVTGTANNVLTIPLSAVNTDVDGTYCYIMEGGVAVRRPLVLGLTSDTMAEVKEGLYQDDEVILSSQNIMEGMNVTTDPAYAPADTAGMMAMMVG